MILNSFDYQIRVMKKKSGDDRRTHERGEGNAERNIARRKRGSRGGSLFVRLD